MGDTPKHSVSVAGIVVDDQDRVLVIQRRDNGHWEPPGGVLEVDEAPILGVEREVYEETGLYVVVQELSGVYKNMSRSIVSLVFRCRVVGGERALSDETSAVEWRTLANAVHDMTPAYAVRIADAFRKGVQVRCHDGVNLIEGLNENVAAGGNYDSGTKPRPPRQLR